MRRVVITGMGAFAAPGRDVKAFFDNLVKGHSAVCRITQFDPAPLTVQIGAEIAGYDPKDYFPHKRLDLLDRFSQFALLAAGEAIESSGIVIGEEERPRVGVVMGLVSRQRLASRQAGVMIIMEFGHPLESRAIRPTSCP